MKKFRMVWVDGKRLEEVQPEYEKQVRKLRAEGWKADGDGIVYIRPLLDFAHMSQRFSKVV